MVEIGEITGAEGGAYTADFGEVRLQGLAEDFIAAETKTRSDLGALLQWVAGGEAFIHPVLLADLLLA